MELSGTVRLLSTGLLPTTLPEPSPLSLTSHHSHARGRASGCREESTDRPPEFLSLLSFVLCGYRLMFMVSWLAVIALNRPCVCGAPLSRIVRVNCTEVGVVPCGPDVVCDSQL